jgi:hypothetical protein
MSIVRSKKSQNDFLKLNKSLECLNRGLGMFSHYFGLVVSKSMKQPQKY